MEFLIKYNFTKKDIETIEKSITETELRNVKMNANNIVQVVDYLTSLGITKDTMRDLFIYQIGIFHRTKGELEQVFDEYEIESIVKSLNYDVNTTDMVEF